MEGSTSMLTALPTHSLTHLDLQGLHGPVHGPAVSAALARLNNLQRLRVAMQRAPCSCLAGVAQLTRLMSLELGGYWSGSKQPLQQLLLQPLPLQVLCLSMYEHLPLLDLSHLTQLQELCDRSYNLTAVFPPQLQQLEIWRVSSKKILQPVMPLQQLRSLMFTADVDEPGQLLSRLAQLPALKQMWVVFDRWQPAAAAVTWSQPPQLRELAVRFLSDGPSRRQWQAILNGVAASTNLTTLWLDAVCGGDGDSNEGDGADGTWNNPCAKLAGLTTLKDLRLSDGSQLLAPGDALALTALTGLTHLALRDAGAGVGDEAAAALAGSCQQLRHLDLHCCNLISMACLANVAHLMQLTELQLDVNSGLTQQGLLLLTGLKRLQHLGVENNVEVTGEVVKNFWAAVRGQQL
ncbi:hypothetical protein COO60DRAFT_1689590 [Scenedesmus sp. NREL 46B-D3]|nr:hypothetical protein COO60DRAFT_1689590 [Scenedesmus sp. NREL 46B-D3]